MDYKDKYNFIKVVEDPTEGLVELGIVERTNADRKSKITNNFISQVRVLDSKALKKVTELLNKKLPKKSSDEIILGLQTSGTPMAAALALERGSDFVFSTSGEFGDISSVFNFIEGHRDDKKHFIYGIKGGDSVVIVEDEITSGNGIISLIKALQDFGIKIVAVATAIEVVTFDAKKHIKEETGIDIISLIKIEVS